MKNLKLTAIHLSDFLYKQILFGYVSSYSVIAANNLYYKLNDKHYFSYFCWFLENIGTFGSKKKKKTKKTESFCQICRNAAIFHATNKLILLITTLLY